MKRELNIEVIQSTVDELTDAINVLSKYFDIDLKYKTEIETEFYYVYAYLREWHKINPHIKFIEI